MDDIRPLATWRAARALSQRALADQAQVVKSTIHRIETGHAMSPTVIRKLAAALDIEPGQIREWVDQNDTAPEANPGGS